MGLGKETLGLECFGITERYDSITSVKKFIDPVTETISQFYNYSAVMGTPVMAAGIMGVSFLDERTITAGEVIQHTEIRVHPEVFGRIPSEIGLEVFGIVPTLDSAAQLSQFVDVEQVRDHWLSHRSSLSNWRTSRMNEEKLMVSLSNQLGSISADPLLFNGLPADLGHSAFGGKTTPYSKITKSLEKDIEDTLAELIDTLATEDLDPIVTEDEMDEIALG